MATVTQQMGLMIWDSPNDPYNSQQLATNWQIVNFHDHSPGRGVQISQAGIAPGAVGPTQLSPTVPTVPTGSILLWSTSTPPSGYLACDGTAYQQTQYANLFVVIGSIYNNSPPVGYFNVPLITFGGPPYGQIMWVIKY